MKLLTFILLSSFSLASHAELNVNETKKTVTKPGTVKITKQQNTTKSSNKPEEKKVEKQVEKQVEKKADNEFVIPTMNETELVATTSSIYSLTIPPSEQAQSYSLKITKDKKVFLNSRFYSSPYNVVHKLNLNGGPGTYKIEYAEYGSINTTLYRLKTKTIDLVYRVPAIIGNIKATKYVQALDPRITELAYSITANEVSEMDKVSAIDRWIVSNIIYNYSSTMMSQSIDAITTLELKMGICTGYANLFAALARASGLETKAITGKARIDGKKYYHQWNEVKIDGVWYFIDTTWNAVRGSLKYFSKASEYPASHYGGKEVRSY